MIRSIEKNRRQRGPSVRRRLACAIALLALVAAPVAAGADASTDPDLRAMKTHWQSRYRNLLLDAARLRTIVERETELYADANRRNYRRGTKRHTHREAAAVAAQELVKVEAELATIEDDARRAGALPGWLYEVEFEMENGELRPEIAAGPDSEREQEPDDGRNPLYADEDL